MIKTILLGIFVLSCIGGLIYLFSTPVATTDCANGMLNCLETNAHLPFFEKMGQGFVCLYQNVRCVLLQ